MKKILVSIVLIGGLAALSPVIAQRTHPQTEYNNNGRGDNREQYADNRRGEDHDRMEGRRDNRHSAQWREHRDRDRRKHHCDNRKDDRHRNAPVHRPRGGGRG